MSGAFAETVTVLPNSALSAGVRLVQIVLQDGADAGKGERAAHLALPLATRR